MNINFTKIEASGNDFILIDNRKGTLLHLTKTIRRSLCSRKTGIGADGLIVLEKDTTSPFLMRYYNADGGEAEMCGNGARCVARYAFAKRITGEKFSFASQSGMHAAEILKNNLIKVELPACVFKKSARLTINGKIQVCDFLIVGVPHIVILTRKLETIDVTSTGRRIRNLNRFKPSGTNVNFVQHLGKNKIRIRTYERGVENETLACGTGVAAAAAVLYRKKMVSSPIYAKTRSGETITVQLKRTKDSLIPFLVGGVRIVYSGAITV